MHDDERCVQLSCLLFSPTLECQSNRLFQFLELLSERQGPLGLRELARHVGTSLAQLYKSQAKKVEARGHINHLYGVDARGTWPKAVCFQGSG